MILWENINICGIKHAGKSSAANALGTALGIQWVDSDEVLRDEYNYRNGKNLSVREIYHELGEESFRKFEAEILRKLWEYEDKGVIALGGGALNNPFLSPEDLENAGMIVCIDVPDKIAYDRILKKGLPPFLQKEQDPYAAFCKMNEERRSFFQKTAHLIIHADGKSSPYSNADAILEAYNKKWNSKG